MGYGVGKRRIDQNNMGKGIKYNWDILAPVSNYNAKTLASICNMSVRQLQRQFRSEQRCPPQEWLDERRILVAQVLLCSGESVKKVAFDLGFKQSSHFCRKFKRAKGVTPSQSKVQYVIEKNVAIG